MAGFDGQRFTAQSVHTETDLLGDDQQDVLGAAVDAVALAVAAVPDFGAAGIVQAAGFSGCLRGRHRPAAARRQGRLDGVSWGFLSVR